MDLSTALIAELKWRGLRVRLGRDRIVHESWSIMARTKKQAEVLPDPPRFVFRGYVRADFVATDKEAFKSWHAGRDTEALIADVIVLVEDGYKVSVGETQRGVSAALANFNGPEAYRGYMLSAFAGDALTALSAVVYKHLVLLDRDWGDVTPSEDDLLR